MSDRRSQTQKTIIVNGEEYTTTGRLTSSDSSKALEFLEKKKGEQHGTPNP